MRVMVIVKATKNSEAGMLPNEKLLAEMGRFNEELAKAGVLLAGEGLHPSARGKRMVFSGGTKTVTDGPFADAQELVAGYWLWQVKSMDEAIEWLRRCPDPMPGEESVVEIRQVFEPDDFGAALTPELRAREEELRGKLDKSLKRPALDPATLAPRSTSGYPEPFRSQVLPREKRALGDALGLTQVGVNLTTLLPGKASSMRHFHSREDELVFVLEGEVVLVTDGGEQRLTPGMCAGFPAGVADGHHLLNRSDQPSRYLEISNRDEADDTDYPDIDLAYRARPGGDAVFTRKDGTPY